MGRKVRITEEQYDRILKEGVLPKDKIQVNAPTTEDGKNRTPQEAIKATQDKIRDAGGRIEAFDVTAKTDNPGIKMVSDTSDSNSNDVVSESKLITKKQLQERRLKLLKENSQLYTVKDFIKKFQ